MNANAVVVLKRTRKSHNWKTGKDYFLVGYYNSTVNRFGAKCFASWLIKADAAHIYEREGFSPYNVTMEEFDEESMNRVNSPKDAPQFTDDPLLRG